MRPSRGLIDRLGLTFGRLDDPVKTLSGGNQQKVVLAKWLALGAALPAARWIRRAASTCAPRRRSIVLLQELAAEGLAIVLQSTDYEELIHVCHRVYVFYRGRVVREMSGAEVTPDALIAATLNVDSETAANDGAGASCAFRAPPSRRCCWRYCFALLHRDSSARACRSMC